MDDTYTVTVTFDLDGLKEFDREANKRGWEYDLEMIEGVCDRLETLHGKTAYCVNWRAQ